uniref:Uncharacterized protein n=1 Tax=Clytia hemisphaerica TaxID=252671 RepID=A0A7M6DR37_9CNID
DEYRNAVTYKLGHSACVELSTKDLSFNQVKPKVQAVNAFTKLQEINEKPEESVVNVQCHVSVVCEAQEIDTRFGRRRKMSMVYVNDDPIKDQMWLVIWGNHLSHVNKSGSYRFKELRVKNYNGKYFTTTAHTEIAAADAEFA